MATKKQNIEIANLLTTADALAEQHFQYTEQFVTRANDELYRLLGGMMALCIDVQASVSCDSIIKQMRKTLKDDYQVTTQANSPVTSIVVRYVTRTGRKTAHVYGRVIQTAIEAGVTAAGLPDYIRANNGIDAIRQKGVAAQTAHTKASGAAMDSILPELASLLRSKAGKSLGTVKLSQGKRSAQMLHNACEFSYLICSNSPTTGELEVVGVAYPTLEVENKILENYITALQLSAIEHTNKFYDECKKLDASQDTVITWRKANGITCAADALARLNDIGVSLCPAELELVQATHQYKNRMLGEGMLSKHFEIVDDVSAEAQHKLKLAA